ncbi:MAG: TMEM175 family protein [Ilumatobacteraceae bacterium]
MARRTAAPTETGFARVVNFSDAVVAIAISLLILPVVDDVSAGTGSSAREILDHNGDRLFAFVISFLVIARFWTAHHRIFESLGSYTTALLWSNLLWLLTIVFVPLPTELLGVRGSSEAFVRFVYIGSVLASSLALLLIQLIIEHTPALLLDPDGPRDPIRLAYVTPALLTVALVVGVAVPAIGMWALLLLSLSGWVGRHIPGATPTAEVS